MDTLGNCLQDLDINRRSAAVIAVVLVLVVPSDAFSTFEGSKFEGGGFCYAGHDLARVEGKNGRVYVDIVGVENRGEVDRLENGCREVTSKWVFIGACVTSCFGMERFCFLQEPIQPAPFELELFQFLKSPFLVYLWVVSELSPLYQAKDDRVFKPGQHGPDPVEVERIVRDRVVGLHLANGSS